MRLWCRQVRPSIGDLRDCLKIVARCVGGKKRLCQGTREIVRMLQESYFAMFMKTLRNPKRNHPKIAYIKLKTFYNQSTTFYQRYKKFLFVGHVNNTIVL